MAVLDRLERAEGLTEAEADLACYIAAHADEVAHIGIADLARARFTSNATIIRLCRKVGAAGFRELKVELAADAEKRRLARVEVDTDWPFTSGDDVSGIMGGIAALSREAVDACYGAVAAADIRRAAELIRAAGRVHVLAVGDSLLSALAFGNLLMKLGISSADASRFGEPGASLYTARPGDVLLAVTYGGELLAGAEAARLLALARERGCRTVVVSAAEPPLGIDLAIRIPAREGRARKVATFYSQACIRYILNCIYAEVYALDFEGSMRRKAQTEHR